MPLAFTDSFPRRFVMGVSGILSTSERGLSMPVVGATRGGVMNVVVSDVAGTVAGTWACCGIVESWYCGRGVPGGWKVVASRSDADNAG